MDAEAEPTAFSSSVKGPRTAPLVHQQAFVNSTAARAGCPTVPRVSPAPKNPRRISDLGALRIVDADKWARSVNRAVKAAQGSLDEASVALSVSRRTLQRWLADDDRLAPSRELVAARVGRPRGE